MTDVVLTPIEASDLDAVGRFLTEHMNAKIAPEAWKRSVTHAWSAQQPNYGMKLMHGDKLVGAFLAIYSDQRIRGESVRVCNPHTWCVLPEYRGKAVQLASAIVKQPGYHYSMLTPNPNVDAVFRFMKFKLLDDRVSIFPNLPGLGSGKVVSDPADIRAWLSPDDLADFEHHATIPWLKHFVAGVPGDSYCWVIYKPHRWKRLPCAELLHVSDAAAFRRHAALIRNYLLFNARMVWTRVETRFIGEHPRLAHRTQRTQPKLVLSKLLQDGDVRNLYSELASLDL